MSVVINLVLLSFKDIVIIELKLLVTHRPQNQHIILSIVVFVVRANVRALVQVWQTAYIYAPILIYGDFVICIEKLLPTVAINTCHHFNRLVNILGDFGDHFLLFSLEFETE